ncbi:hypothetical protein [Paenibacillus sp. NPDC093718]|uniref:hypothetical protein n=1 Tax=Paenibacillus sp. NPDC093718 TaxID=3390601 RepID=UPI003D02B111
MPAWPRRPQTGAKLVVRQAERTRRRTRLRPLLGSGAAVEAAVLQERDGLGRTRTARQQEEHGSGRLSLSRSDRCHEIRSQGAVET